MKKKIVYLLMVAALIVTTGCAKNIDSTLATPDNDVKPSINEEKSTEENQSGNDVDETTDEAANYMDVTDVKEISVNNVEDFIKAISDNTVIKLAPGEYNITEYISSNSSEFPHGEYGEPLDGVAVYDEFDGLQLSISSFHDLTIESEDINNPASIVCEPRYARVLEFYNCVNISLNNLIMGHTPDEAYCTGSVVLFDDCGNISIIGCDLYGCGTYGFEVYRSPYILVKDSCIHDCSYGCAIVNTGSYAKIMNTEFRDCREFSMFEAIGESNIAFIDCTFSNLDGNMLSLSEDSYTNFDNCTFGPKELESIKMNPLYGENIFVSGEDYNSFNNDGMASNLSDEELAQQQSVYDWFNGIWLCSGKGYTITMTLNDYGQMSLVFKLDSGEIIKREGSLLLEWVGNPTGDYPPRLASFGITDDPNNLDGVFTFEDMADEDGGRGISLVQVSAGESVLSSITGEYAFYWKKIG